MRSSVLLDVARDFFINNPCYKSDHANHLTRTQMTLTRVGSGLPIQHVCKWSYTEFLEQMCEVSTTYTFVSMMLGDWYLDLFPMVTSLLSELQVWSAFEVATNVVLNGFYIPSIHC